MTAILPLLNPPRIRGGLESVVAPLLGRDGQPLSVSEWSTGAELTSLPDANTFFSSRDGGTWGDPEDDDLKPVSEAGAREKFLPGSVGAVFECGMNAPNTTLGDIPREEATRFMDRALFSLIATAITTVTTPAIDCDNDATLETLPNIAQTPDGYDDDNPPSIRGGLQGLLEGVCAHWHSDPIFLAPREYMPHFLGDIVRWHEELDQFRFGPHAIAFDCFENVGPAGTTTNPDGSEVWVYALLPIQLAVADPVDDSISAVRTHLQNVYRVRVEREFLAAFEGYVLATKMKVG